jgi:hypothetical protein
MPYGVLIHGLLNGGGGIGGENLNIVRSSAAADNFLRAEPYTILNAGRFLQLPRLHLLPSPM